MRIYHKNERKTEGGEVCISLVGKNAFPRLHKLYYCCIRLKWLLVFMFPDYLLNVCFYGMSNFKFKSWFFFLTSNSTWMLSLLIESFFFKTFQFTRFLNDFLSSDLHLNLYEVVMRQFILGNTGVNVVKTGQFLHDISVDSLK